MPLRMLTNPHFWEPKNPENIKQHCPSPKQETVRIEPKPLPAHCQDRNRLKKIEHANESRRYAIFEEKKKQYEDQPISSALQHLLSPVKKNLDESMESPRMVRVRPTPVPDFKKLHQSLENVKA
jgi:hypothetical protein